MKSNTFQIDALDGLRGLAAIIVLLSHTSNAGMYYLPYADFSGIGKSGVYLFFILSAFLLTRPILLAPSEFFSLEGIRRYATRRILRIFPLYTVFLLIAVLSTIYPLSLAEKTVRLPYSMTWAELLNHLLLQGGKGVAWSIPVEFKFYIILPLVALVTSKFLRANLWTSIGFMTLLFLCAYFYRNLDGKEFQLLHTVSYIEAFLFGAIAAVIKHNLDRGTIKKSSKHFHIFSTFAVIGLIVTIPSVYSLIIGHNVKSSYFHNYIFMISFFWFLVLLSLITLKSGLVIKFFSNKLVRYLGKISFSLYLVHSSVIKIVVSYELNPFLSAWLILLFSIITSSITFYLIEKPFSRIHLSSRTHSNYESGSKLSCE